nr:xylulose kinase-1 [Tanacetum cinerariifolium]
MVAYLSKSDASKGFNQVIDFLNGSSIKYALTVNPNIYVSCIKQFWTTVAVKQVNNVTRLQALVDRKNVVVTEATIREALHLDDAEGVDCLPNQEIFAELARMGYKNPSTKLTLVRNVDSTTKFYMYPCFLQLIIRKQVGDEDEKVEEVNAGDTDEGDDSAAHKEVPTITEETSIPSPTPPTPSPQPPQDIPSTSQKLERHNKVRELKLKRLQKVGTSQRVETSDDTMMDDESNQRRMITEIDQDDAVVLEDDKEEDREVADAVKDVEEPKVDESSQDQGRQVESQAEIYKIDMDHANKLITEVVTASSETVTAASAIATTAEAQVPDATTATLTAPILVEEPKPLKKKQQIEQDEQYARELHAELNKDIDWDEAIDHVKLKAKEDPAMKKYQAMKKKPRTEAQARKNMMMYLKNAAGFKMYYFKGMSYDDIRPIFEAKFNLNVAFLLKTKEQIEEDENRALQKINETPAERATKRRKLDEEVENLKRHLQIVPNEDDDVYSEATPLARKVPVVDYEIIEMNNKPYYKIIRADVERRYPLLRFTLDQMLNDVRLQVEEESEVSLELLRFTRQQHQEGQLE